MPYSYSKKQEQDPVMNVVWQLPYSVLGEKVMGGLCQRNLFRSRDGCLELMLSGKQE